MLILDTDHISLLERPGGEATQRLRDRLRSVDQNEIVTTIVSYEE